ncbi:translation initiation factor IF-2 [Phycomyces blakesleeanus]|uniref:Translation initiation factor IF-2, mitochondrial n=1 Tax=Phycomyces blakesleeanus TaxID=4837 RepID=A0ABR3AST5_PHYBL
MSGQKALLLCKGTTILRMRSIQGLGLPNRRMTFQTSCKVFESEKKPPGKIEGLGKLDIGANNAPGRTIAKTDWSAPPKKERSPRTWSRSGPEGERGGQQRFNNQRNNNQDGRSPRNDTPKKDNAPSTSGKRISPKRDWTRPVDQHVEKYANELPKQHERHVMKFSKPPPVNESATQRRERKQKEEELAKAIREEEKARQMILDRRAKQRAKEAELARQSQEVYIPEIINVANLSRVLGVRIEQIIQTMEELDMGSTSHDRMLNSDESSLIAMQLDMNPVVDSRQSLDLFPRPPTEDTSKLPGRPPIVTIMGHVDHGKTTLLDTLRQTSVAAGEAGGITQHIGAFSVQLPSKKQITFLDTPGHAAFSSMRARGAQVTDIIVLVVAADDGVMPQTQEAIQHAHNSGVPLVVAINKCDKPGVDSSKVKQELARYNVHLEEIGGDVPCVEVSGLTGLNLDQLEETISTLSEVLELKAERNAGAEGVVIESQMEKGRGNVATVLVRSGTLKVGSVVVAGQTWCKIRSMTDHTGKSIKEALPGTPVKVIGWKEVPHAGDEMLPSPDENTAKTVVDNRLARQQRDQQLRDLEVINDKRRAQREQLEQERLAEKAYKKEMYLYQRGMTEKMPDSLGKRMSELQADREENAAESGPIQQELRAVVKGDVSGTVEAVVDCLNGLQNKLIKVKVVQSGVGNITEGDVLLAAACEGQVIGFNVKADKKIQAEASRHGVNVRSYSVIYKLLEEVKDQLSDMLPPIVTTQVVGEASILQVFDISTKGRETKPVAGCRVTNGAINRNGRVRIVRNKETIWEGELDQLRQVKKDIAEAKKGLECGMSFEGFKEFQAGDIIQCIQAIETKQRL